MKVAVIGAGPAGMTAAYQLAKARVEVKVFEAAPCVGGLARSLELWNQKVDLGPHRFFSKDERVNRLWLEVVGRDYCMVNRITRIYYGEKCFKYPLRALDCLLNLSPAVSMSCLLSYLKEKIHPTALDGSFETWVTHRFGRKLFEVFFKTYSEKLWGISCAELSDDFAAQRIKKLSLSEAIRNALFKPKLPSHATLLDRFAYPNEGTGMVYQRMAAAVQKKGGKIHLGAPVKSVLLRNGFIDGIELVSGSKESFDHVISTMPLTLLVQSLPGAPEKVMDAAKSLTFRNTIIVYLKVDSPTVFRDNWIYIHSPQFKAGRITNFRNWSTHLHEKETATILAVEFWCSDDDSLWSAADSGLIELAGKEVRQTGLIQDHKISNGHVHRIRRCYPVYRIGYKKHLEIVQDFVRGIKGLQAIGRYGAFKYNNQDHSILMGILAAENVVSSAQHDLWQINTDYDTYQESAITEEGLVITKPG